MTFSNSALYLSGGKIVDSILLVVGVLRASLLTLRA